MNESPDQAPQQPESNVPSLEALVRADLDRRADAIDPMPLLRRIQASAGLPSAGGSAGAAGESPMSLAAHRRRRGGLFRWAGGLSAAAAAVLLGVFLLMPSTPAQASAEAIVREAQAAAAVPLDRCYLVEVRRESEELDQSYLMNQQSRVSRLWTRGDRFMFESLNSPRRFAWGRDGVGNYWVSLNRERGLRFESFEVPQWLTISADVVGMRMDQLLDLMTRDFDLVREQPMSGQPNGTVTIRATLKPGRNNVSVRAARVEFDTATKVVRKLVLERVRSGKLVATVSYWLIETEARGDALYELESHLEAPYEVYSRSFMPQRRDVIARVFFAASAGGEIPQMPVPPRGTMGERPRPFPATRPFSRPVD
jgi:hypothetical protein